MRCREDKDGAKKYRVSYITGPVLIMGLAAELAQAALLTVILSIIDVADGVEWFVYMLYGMMLLGIVMIIVYMFNGLSTYKFSISSAGITMYEPRHVYKFAWDEFTDCGIAFVNVSTSDTRNTFWIYFAKRCLRESEKYCFLVKLKKKRDYIAYFQYSPEIYEEVKQYFPAEWREKIDRELAPWIENMTFTEKRINR